MTQTARFLVVSVACLALAHCASRVDPKYGVSSSPRVVANGETIPKGGGTYRVGKPYVVAGRTYVPQEDSAYRADGIASWYGDDFHGRLTANGEVFDMNSISAAHPTLPMPSYVRVTNLANHRSLVVRVNDRGPYAENRVIDLSVRAAKLLGFYDRGLAKVRVEYVGRAPLEGSDDRQLVATLREGDPAPAPSLVRVASARPFVPQSAEPDLPAHSAPSRSSERSADLGREPSEALLKRSIASAPSALPSRTPPETAVLRKVASAAALPADPPEVLSATGASPVSAFAPTRYDAPAAFLSGRGLY